MPTTVSAATYTARLMAKPKQPLSTPEDTLETLLDRVSNAREELVAIERTLERLRSDISTLQKKKSNQR